MKSVLLLLLGGIGLAAQAQEQAADAPQLRIAADTSFVQQSQAAPAQLPDVNEQEGVGAVVPSFVTESQNQAMMLGGLLAAGFLVRRRRDH